MTSLSFCACPPSLWEKNYSGVGHSLKISNDLKPDLWRYRGGPVRRWSGNGSWLEATFPTRPNGGYRASGAPQPTKVVHYDKVNFPKEANLSTREKCNIFRLCLQNILAGHFDNGGNRAELTKVVHYDYKEANLSTRFSKGWGLSVKLGKHSAIWGKLGTALQAYTLNPCTKFPQNPTSRKVNT